MPINPDCRVSAAILCSVFTISTQLLTHSAYATEKFDSPFTGLRGIWYPGVPHSVERISIRNCFQLNRICDSSKPVAPDCENKIQEILASLDDVPGSQDEQRTQNDSNLERAPSFVMIQNTDSEWKSIPLTPLAAEAEPQWIEQEPNGSDAEDWTFLDGPQHKEALERWCNIDSNEIQD